MVMLIQRIAYAHLPVSFNYFLFELVINALVNDQPARRGAALSSRTYCAKNGTNKHCIEVRILAHDDGVVAAQF